MFNLLLEQVEAEKLSSQSVIEAKTVSCSRNTFARHAEIG
jgi:hypothetical protein